MRDRSRVVIIKDDQVALIKRVRNGMIYYVFPGGGVELGETPREAAVREAFEELGVQVEVGALVAINRFRGVTSHFFLATIREGKFGTGTGEEYGPDRGRGSYEPVWLPLSNLARVDVRPRGLAPVVAAQQFSTPLSLEG